MAVEGGSWCPRRRLRSETDGVDEADSWRLARLTAAVADWTLNGREMEFEAVEMDALVAEASAWSYASRPWSAGHHVM